MKPQILINCGNDWYEFSKSKTGQLDYVGKVENLEPPSVKGYQKIASSSYYSPSWYIYVQDRLNFCPVLYVAEGVDVSDSNVFSYLVHIGALLAAIEAGDSALAGELYLRRRSTFDNYFQLTSYIFEKLCVEVLFYISYGKMNNLHYEEVSVIFNSAKKKMKFEPSKERLEQAFIRWIKENGITVTLPLVGEQFYHWIKEPEVLEKLTDNLGCENILEKAEKIRSAKHEFYEGLECCVQAEPYNPYDQNAILASIESIEAKICGNPGLEKAGHIRAAAAEIIRGAKPEKMAYDGKLLRLSYNETVVKLSI